MVSLNLYASSDPLFIPFALKAKSCQIAEEYNVIWSIEEEDSELIAKYEDKIMLKLTLRGLATEVQHVRTTIKRK